MLSPQSLSPRLASPRTGHPAPPPDPLSLALARKARADAPGALEDRTLAQGPGWRVRDVVCTSGPRDLPFEERHGAASVSLVLSGQFVYRGGRGEALLAPGALLLGSPGHSFECSHRHGEGDRCLSFQLDAGPFERVAGEAGAARAAFDADRLPPLRALAPLVARARLALERRDCFEEIALELAAAALRAAAGAGPDAASGAADAARVARVLRRLEARSAEPHPLSALARDAGLSKYHFLRAFKRATGVTPHQWLLRARLRDAAQRLATTRAPVTEIALAVGFDDLSHFIRSFRAEFGASPSRYRTRA